MTLLGIDVGEGEFMFFYSFLFCLCLFPRCFYQRTRWRWWWTNGQNWEGGFPATRTSTQKHVGSMRSFPWSFKPITYYIDLFYFPPPQSFKLLLVDRWDRCGCRMVRFKVNLGKKSWIKNFDWYRNISGECQNSQGVSFVDKALSREVSNPFSIHRS